MKTVWRRVEKAVFYTCLNNYPKRLTHDFFMDLDSWYDLSITEEPCEESKMFKIYLGEEYYIKCAVSDSKQ